MYIYFLILLPDFGMSELESDESHPGHRLNINSENKLDIQRYF